MLPLSPLISSKNRTGFTAPKPDEEDREGFAPTEYGSKLSKQVAGSQQPNPFQMNKNVGGAFAGSSFVPAIGRTMATKLNPEEEEEVPMFGKTPSIMQSSFSRMAK